MAEPPRSDLGHFGRAVVTRTEKPSASITAE